MPPVVRLVAVLLLAAAGCDGGPALVPAAGRVAFRDGKPVTGGVVEFSPEGGGPAARTAIGPDGRFALTTGGRAGAVAGRHRVAVVQVAPPAPPGGHAGHARPPAVHRRHARFDTSGLTATVGPGPAEDLVLTVDPAG